MPTKKELRLYGDLIYQHKPTIKTVIWQLLIDYFAKKNRHRKSPYKSDAPLESIAKESSEPPVMSHFAIVKNNSVKEIIVVNAKIAAMLRSRGIRFVEFDPQSEQVSRGTAFENNKFVIEFEEEPSNGKED